MIARATARSRSNARTPRCTAVVRCMQFQTQEFCSCLMSALALDLAHSLVARAQGLPVRTITLFLFGGVSNIQREPRSPGAEFLMAIVGPITSIVLGVIFFVLGGISAGTLAQEVTPSMTGLAHLSPLAIILVWLGQINILPGLF